MKIKYMYLFVNKKITKTHIKMTRLLFMQGNAEATNLNSESKKTVFQIETYSSQLYDLMEGLLLPQTSLCSLKVEKITESSKYPWRGCCHEITRATGFVVLPSQSLYFRGRVQIVPRGQSSQICPQGSCAHRQLGALLGFCPHFQDNIHSLRGCSHSSVEWSPQVHLSP